MGEDRGGDGGGLFEGNFVMNAPKGIIWVLIESLAETVLMSIGR